MSELQTPREILDYARKIQEMRYEINNPPLIISQLTEEDKFRAVTYASLFERGNVNPSTESGYITSWNSTYIFVCFDTSGNGKACNPEDLTFQTILLKQNEDDLITSNSFDLDCDDLYISL